jgi:hypothetical protein
MSPLSCILLLLPGPEVIHIIFSTHTVTHAIYPKTPTFTPRSSFSSFEKHQTFTASLERVLYACVLYRMCSQYTIFCMEWFQGIHFLSIYGMASSIYAFIQANVLSIEFLSIECVFLIIEHVIFIKKCVLLVHSFIHSSFPLLLSPPPPPLPLSPSPPPCLPPVCPSASDQPDLSAQTAL